MALERLFSVFRISGSGLSAQRKLIEATASNIANVDSTQTKEGGPYIPKRVSFQESRVHDTFTRLLRAESRHVGRVQSERTFPVNRRDSSKLGSGVEALEGLDRQEPFQMVFEPENPNANDEGYVRKPNVNMVKEMTSMMIASRAYEANVTVMNAAKAMMKKALEI